MDDGLDNVGFNVEACSGEERNAGPWRLELLQYLPTSTLQSTLSREAGKSATTATHVDRYVTTAALPRTFKNTVTEKPKEKEKVALL